MSAGAEVYEIRVRGHLDRHWATWSGCTDLVPHDDGTTTLRTGLVDQAQLHGILARLRDTGAAWLSSRNGWPDQRRVTRGGLRRGTSLGA